MKRGLVQPIRCEAQQRTITQQGRTFTYQANSFDDYGRPAQVARTGPSGAGSTVSRVETTTYDNNT